MQIYSLLLFVPWLYLDVCVSVLLYAFTYWADQAGLFADIQSLKYSW